MHFFGMEGLLEQMKDCARIHSHKKKKIKATNKQIKQTNKKPRMERLLKQIGLNKYFRAEHKKYIIIYSRYFG